MTDEAYLKKIKNKYRHYYKNSTLLFALGIIWLIAAYTSIFDMQTSIFIFFIGVTILKLILSVISKLFKTKAIHKDDSLKLLMRLIILGVIFGLIAGFFAFIYNINLFFPVFTIIFSVIFGCIAYFSKLKIYGLLSITLMVGGIFIGYKYSHEFNYAGYFSGSTMVAFGILNGVLGKILRIYFKRLNRKFKFKTISFKIDRPTFTKKLKKGQSSETKNV